jgi:hypothetical protein
MGKCYLKNRPKYFLGGACSVRNRLLRADAVSNGGYIALTSVIIISLLLITIITALSSINYFSRYNILENEFKDRSSGLAEACVDYALGKIGSNSAYAGGECVVIGSDKCKIVSVSGNVVVTQGVFQKSYTNLSVGYNPTTLAVTSWQELPNVTTALCP